MPDSKDLDEPASRQAGSPWQGIRLAFLIPGYHGCKSQHPVHCPRTPWGLRRQVAPNSMFSDAVFNGIRKGRQCSPAQRTPHDSGNPRVHETGIHDWMQRRHSFSCSIPVCRMSFKACSSTGVVQQGERLMILSYSMHWVGKSEK